MTRSGRRIEEAALPAILIRRSDLPVPLDHPARSFFGGLPRLPPELQWPTAEVTANETPETVALTFVAQIDLAEAKGSNWSSLPAQGTLYFFCSSVFVDVAEPPCRVLYSPRDGDAYPDRPPPPNLMPLAGTDGDAQVRWLDPAIDFHATVEFKYPLSFRPFRDFYFGADFSGGQVMVDELCRVLGPGEPQTADLLQFRSVADYEKDEDWPFNWLLITYVVRAVLSHILSDLTRDDKPVADDVIAELKRLRAGAIGWLERCRTLTSLDAVETDTKLAFRSWWLDVVRTYESMGRKVGTYASEFAHDLGHAINHTLRCMATQDADACDDAPASYVENLARQNHWKAPEANDGKNGHFGTALHQMLGYGNGAQNAPEEHLKDILLLQLQGDRAFFNWHSNTGGVLHFWIKRKALMRLDLSGVVATYECD